MRKQSVKIDGDKCVGCGACAAACQGGAIGMVDGKARLLRGDYCDGLIKCLPVCPAQAISVMPGTEG
jgi:ferredoxin